MTDRHIPTALRFMLAARRSELQGLEALIQTCELVACISELVHALQRERGYTNLYLGNPTSHHLAQLRQSSEGASAAQCTVEAHFQRVEEDSVGKGDHARLFIRLAYVAHGLAEAPGLRRRVIEHRVDAVAATLAFTRLIGGLLAVIFEAADTALEPQVTRVLVALFNFLQGKELAGQERASGVAGFSRGGFDAALRERMDYLAQAQARSFQSFDDFAEGQGVRQWHAQQASETTAQVDRLRRLAMSTSETAKVDTGLSELWFELTTRRIDAMREIENHLTGLLLETCRRSIGQARADLANHRALVARLEGLGSSGTLLFNVQARDADSAAGEGLSPHLERSVLELLHEQARHLHSARDERDEARQALAARKAIERAKHLMMTRHGLSEHDAYERMRTTAMQRGQRMVEVAEAVLAHLGEA